MKAQFISIAALLMMPGFASGAAGTFDELIWTTTTTPFSFANSTFFEIDDNSTNLFGASEFQGADLGTFNVGSALYLTGEQKSFKNSGTNVESHTLFWSITGTGGSGSGSLNYLFEANVGGSAFNEDQRWGAANAGNLTANVLSGLGNGTYTLSVWSRITTNGVDASTEIFNNRGGANYNATLTVIPEPTGALLSVLCVMGLLRRRRV